MSSTHFVPDVGGGVLSQVGLVHIALLAAGLCVAIPAYIFIYNIYFHPLAGFPGPVLYRGFECMKVYQQVTGRISDRLHELHETYGDVVRVSPWELSYTSAGAWHDIAGGKGGGVPTNPAYGLRERDFYGALGLLWLGSDGHARHRRILSPAFSDRSLREQEPVVGKYVDLLIRRMHERAGTTVDMWAWANFTTFDIIGDLTFGEPFNCLEESRFHPWIFFLFSRLKMMMYGQIVMTMGYLGVLIEALVPRRLKQEADEHVRRTKDKVDRRRERAAADDAHRPDFMTHILKNVTDTLGPGSDAKDGSGSGSMTLSELYANCQTLVIAGSETSATLISTAVHSLLREPRAMARLAAEVRGAFTREADVTPLAASQLPYLHAVISEALRVRPPLPAGVHRRVGPGGATVQGRFVPEGTSLQVTHWAAYHSSRNFVDPWAFIPERWLPAGDRGAAARFAADNRVVFQPFSVGTRSCLGRGLTYLETRLALARLVWNFDMELMPESEDWGNQRVWLLYEKKPLNVRLTAVRRD
ncbi:hypothetical protein RB595_002705 [Gaeumannomyces hyphopodioides]